MVGCGASAGCVSACCIAGCGASAGCVSTCGMLGCGASAGWVSAIGVAAARFAALRFAQARLARGCPTRAPDGWLKSEERQAPLPGFAWSVPRFWCCAGGPRTLATVRLLRSYGGGLDVDALRRKRAWGTAFPIQSRLSADCARFFGHCRGGSECLSRNFRRQRSFGSVSDDPASYPGGDDLDHDHDRKDHE